MEERAWFRLIRVWGPSLSAIWYWGFWVASCWNPRYEGVEATGFWGLWVASCWNPVDEGALGGLKVGWLGLKNKWGGGSDPPISLLIKTNYLKPGKIIIGLLIIDFAWTEVWQTLGKIITCWLMLLPAEKTLNRGLACRGGGGGGAVTLPPISLLLKYRLAYTRQNYVLSINYRICLNWSLIDIRQNNTLLTNVTTCRKLLSFLPKVGRYSLK